MLGFGQKSTSARISTTMPIKDALHICKIAGEVDNFFSIDYNEKPDTFSMSSYFGPTRIIIEIGASFNNGKTFINLNIPHDHPMFGGYSNILRSYLKRLGNKLENMEVEDKINSHAL